MLKGPLMIHLIVVPPKALPLRKGLSWTTVPDETGPDGLAAMWNSPARCGGGWDVNVDDICGSS